MGGCHGDEIMAAYLIMVVEYFRIGLMAFAFTGNAFTSVAPKLERFFDFACLFFRITMTTMLTPSENFDHRHQLNLS